MIKQEVEKLEREYFTQAKHYLIAAFGLVAGLAWNDAIKALIDYLFPQDQNTIWAKFIYALIMTAVVVALSKSISKIIKTPKVKI